MSKRLQTRTINFPRLADYEALSACTSPPTRSSISSGGHDSPDLDDVFFKTASPKALNLQIPLRKHNTPSPKSISSPKQIGLMRAYQAYFSKPKKNKIKETPKQSNVTNELASAMQEKFELEVQVARLRFELQKGNLENKKLKEKEKTIESLNKHLNELMEENKILKEKKNKVKKRVNIEDLGRITRSMEEFKKKFMSFLNNYS
ncbi:unnamed protein product [Blepharisma stoltei]|uniref:Uncharacterized protein n=1 Tax=Blepharisma stoltei TaxID=1481888 RepID=A0AAU9IF09_9CILI|nr:unnamed protein product [Blepharisma stoltei]